MLCYRDRTFCDFTDCAKYDDCPTAITDENRAHAKEIGLGFCVYADRPDCYKEE